MHKIQLLAVAALATLGGCAHQLQTAAQPGLPFDTRTVASEGMLPLEPWPGLAQAGDGADEDTLEERARRIFGDAPPVPTNLPDKSLDQELLFKFLLSEIAGQRGNLQLAAQGYLDMARSTRDPRLARRATEIANYARLPTIAVEAARLWYDTDKGNPQARQTLVSVLLSNKKLQEAKPHLQAMLNADGDVAQGFLQLHNLLAKSGDKAAVLSVVRDLAKGYPDMPEAHFAVAQAALAAGNQNLAGSEAGEAMRLRPGWEQGALLQAQIIQQRESPAKAAEYLERFLAAHPKARDVRANYARLLIGDRKLEQARAQYQIMLEEQPGNPDIAVTIGLLSLQLNDFDQAEAKLKRGLELGYRDPDTLRFYIGQSCEERGRANEAMEWYRQVEGGDQYVPAQARYAFLLGRQNKVAEAREYLQNVRVQSDEQRAMLVQAEAQLLREAKDYQQSYDVLARALDKQPENADLLYDSALAAEKLDKLDVTETNLRKLIKLKPDHAQAYNALGYTLADRTDRLTEAKGYIEQALKLAPDDPFILDSMGWVQYRLGNHQEGLTYLQRAYDQRPDPEIAAHLGEVLWIKGRQADAEKVWRGSAQEHPDNELLQETMKRFLE
jgi:tetratricopeptide (TPR) repeat protein